MAWSYTKSSGAVSNIDGSYQAIWTNNWTVEELSPTQSGYIRLRVTVRTDAFYSSSNTYAWYSTDTMSYGGTTYTIHGRSQVPYGYITQIDVPQSWSGKSVTFAIAWTTVSTTLNATGASASTITVSNGTFGQAVPVTLNANVSGLKHTLTVTVKNNNQNVATETLLTKSTTTSLNWTPNLETYALAITTTSNPQAVFSCTTYSGDASIGTTTATINMSFPSLPPSTDTGWAAASPVNTGIDQSLSNVWIQGYSKAQIAFDASKIHCQYNATVRSYSITCNGVMDTTSPYQTGILPATSASVVCTVTDSRGSTATETLTLTLEPYMQPRLSYVSIYRCDANGSATDDGEYIYARVTPACSSLSNLNTCTPLVFIRTSSGSYGPSQSMTYDQNGGFYWKKLSGVDPDVSYVVKLQATDLVGSTAEFEQSMSTRAWAMKFRPTGNGVGFGKAPEADKAIEIPSDWTLKIGTNDLLTIISNKCIELLTNKVYPVGSIYMSTNSTSPATFLGGTWERIEDRFLLAAGSTYGAGSTGGAATVTLTEAEMPSHTHTLYKGGSVLGIGVTHDAETTVGWATGPTFNDRSKAATNLVPTGSGNAHENMPPYLTVYVWKRTA